MLQEAKDLQRTKVDELFKKAHGRDKELTFRAPTGSGKTWMMADFMNRLLSEQDDIIFIVSSLSKGDLARQNYNSFVSNSQSGRFDKIKPYLINTEVSGEEELFIPTDYNVYVLPRDLYKEGGVLKRGAMEHFLRRMTQGDIMEAGKGKKIYLIKDECHVMTSNLDDEDTKKYFARTFNFSATPKLSRGQKPDVLMTDEEAMDAHLIKHVELNEDPNATVDEALDKLIEIKAQYNNLLGPNPCLIIQISNKDKAEEEWRQTIKPALDKHQALKWMLIVDAYKNTGQVNEKKYLECDTNDDVKKKLHPSKWKDYAKGDHSTIDVIIFKMVISEGWDIPRACMLFQVRDTQSTQLDEQVVGRVRRNPRLQDFENLPKDARKLASTAWVWGLRPKSIQESMPVRLWKVGSEYVQNQIRVKTIRLETPTVRKEFDIRDYMSQQPATTTNTSIFDLYRKMQQGDNALQDLCFEYAGNDYMKWWHYMECYDKIKRRYETFICDYDQSMVEDKVTSFPVSSFYLDSGSRNEIDDWVWCRKDSDSTTFAFDSEAEREWASFLSRIAPKSIAVVEQIDDENRYLWGKNFPSNSEIRYEYYTDGLHKSYPDFVMKDKEGRIHIFEVKCLNGSGKAAFSPDEYETKIKELKKCYLYCSIKLKDHIFHVPVKEGDAWQIFSYQDGEEIINSQQTLKIMLIGQ